MGGGATTTSSEEQMPPHDSGSLDLAEGIDIAVQTGAINENTFPDL